MKPLFFSIPSGSHKRAYFQPLYPYIKNDVDLKIIAITPAAKYPKILKEFESGDRLIFKTFDESLFVKFKPNLVTASTCGLDEHDKPILESAKRHQIPTLVYVESWDNVWKMARRKSETISVDRVLVWNQMMKNQLTSELGYQSEKISLAGSARLDNLVLNRDLLSKEELFSKLKLDPNKPLIHIATVELYDISYVVKIISQAKKSGKINKESQIYCSVHPGGEIKNHQWYADKYGVDVLAYSFGRIDNSRLKEFAYNPSLSDMGLLYSLFKHSDVLINFSSTVAIESMLADTPVINVMFGKPFDRRHWRKSAVYRDFKEHYQDIVNSDGTWLVKNKKELIKAVKTYLENPCLHRYGRLKTTEKIITFLDGKCSQRIYQEIKNYVSK